MLRLMATEVADALDKVEGNDEPGLVSLANRPSSLSLYGKICWMDPEKIPKQDHQHLSHPE